MNNLVDQLIPFLRVGKINRTIDVNIATLENSEYQLYLDRVKDKRQIRDSLQKNIEYNEDRRKSVEDKAKSIIFTITVALSFIIGSIQLFDEVIIGNLIGWVVTAFLVIGILLLIISGIVVINAMNIGKLHTPLYYNNYELQENRIVLNPIESEDETLKKLIKSNKINEKIITKKLNLVYTAFITLRNGVVCLATFFLLVVINLMINNKNHINLNEGLSSEKESKEISIKNITLELKVTVPKANISSKDIETDEK